MDGSHRACGRYPDRVIVADGPSVTDWMQGWGSILSLPLSLGALIFTGWLLRHEIRVRREEKADTAAAQARLVVARALGVVLTDIDPNTGHQVGPMVGLKWQIKNYSQAPIFDAIVSVEEWQDNRWGEVIETEASGTVKCDSSLEFGFDPREALVKVEFTDAAGLRWIRTTGEPPERVLVEPDRSRQRLLLRFVRVRRQLTEQLDAPEPEWVSSTTRPPPVAAKPSPDADQDDEQSPPEARPSEA